MLSPTNQMPITESTCGNCTVIAVLFVFLISDYLNTSPSRIETKRRWTRRFLPLLAPASSLLWLLPPSQYVSRSSTLLSMTNENIRHHDIIETKCRGWPQTSTPADRISVRKKVLLFVNYGNFLQFWFLHLGGRCISKQCWTYTRKDPLQDDVQEGTSSCILRRRFWDSRRLRLFRQWRQRKWWGTLATYCLSVSSYPASFSYIPLPPVFVILGFHRRWPS